MKLGNSHILTILRILQMLFVMLIIISGFVFEKTNGLILKWDDDEYIYVTELLTSGSDDNVTIKISFILFIPIMIVSFFRIFKTMNTIEYVFNNLIILLQIFFLVSIEAGSVLKTILYDHNIALLVWLISFVMFICLTQFFYFRIYNKSTK